MVDPSEGRDTEEVGSWERFEDWKPGNPFLKARSEATSQQRTACDLEGWQRRKDMKGVAKTAAEEEEPGQPDLGGF